MATKVKAPEIVAAEKRFAKCPHCDNKKRFKQCPQCGGWFPANIALGWLNCAIFHEDHCIKACW
jgi:hypothetical protein